MLCSSTLVMNPEVGLLTHMLFTLLTVDPGETILTFLTIGVGVKIA